MLSKGRRGMSWVPACLPAQGTCTSGREGIRTHQYRMSASSCSSSVPATTVKPSKDTSQDKRVLCFPSNGTAGQHSTLSVAMRSTLTARQARYTYSQLLQHWCGRPTHARHHPSQTRLSPFDLRQLGSQQHAKTLCLPGVPRTSAKSEEMIGRINKFCGRAQKQTQHNRIRQSR